MAELQLGPSRQISDRLEKARREAGTHNELAVLQSPHFILRYNDKASDRQLGQEILDTLEDLYNPLSRDLTSLAPATVAVILYPDQTYFDITQAPSWTGALFDGKIRVPTRGLTGVTDRLRAILAHELSHSFIASLPGRGSPIWFLEGVAQLQEGKSAANARKLLAQLQRENHLTPLKNLRDSFMGLSPDTAGIAYAESLSAVEYLASQFGRPAIRNLLDLMGQNYNFENAFRTALQRSVSEFEIAWQQDLTR
jgi:Peptidase MA superfamily